VTGAGRRDASASPWLSLSPDSTEPAGNLRMMGGGSNPYGLVTISTPASPRTLYGLHTLLWSGLGAGHSIN